MDTKVNGSTKSAVSILTVAEQLEIDRGGRNRAHVFNLRGLWTTQTIRETPSDIAKRHKSLAYITQEMDRDPKQR